MNALARFKPWLLPMTVVVLGSIVVVDHVRLTSVVVPGPTIPAAADGVALGKAYGPRLAATYGDAWTAAAGKLAAGGTVAEAQTELQTTWTAARALAFDQVVTPTFARVLPAGTEPADDVKRAEVVTLWRDFAKGLKHGH